MKRMALSLLLAVGVASGAPITLFDVSFGGAVVEDLVPGATSVTFQSNSYTNLTCTGPQASLCNVLGTAKGPQDFELTSGVVEEFFLGPNQNGTDLKYITDGGTWTVVDTGNTSMKIATTGFFVMPGFENTYGILNFVFPSVVNQQDNVLIGGFSNPTPEPGSFILVSTGLIGLGLIARRRSRS